MKTTKTFNIYCDESTHLIHDGHPYMVLGYVSIAYNQMDMAKAQIKESKEKHGYHGELKCTKVHEATFQMYNELLDYFFMTDMNFRAVIVDKGQIDESRPDYTFNDFYYRMYYQLLHYEMDLENNYNIYLDIKDTSSANKLHRMQDILKWNASISKLQFVRSHESCFVQMADVIMGAVNYNLRREKGDVQGRSLAKVKLVEKIKEHGDITRTTPLGNRKFNLFFIKLK